jgi:uncharacterized integral membrane protein (TIGR00698 family)
MIPTRLLASARRLAPGLLVAALVALAASFLSEHYGAPAMLMAVLIGMALHFLSEEPRTAPGIDAASRGLLRLGVALLGVRISLGLARELGALPLLVTVAGVAATLLAALALAPLFGRGRRFAVLTGGAVAICGASAALAIAAVLPRHERADRDLAFTVVGVTVLSTLAMILYPVLAAALGLDLRQTGLFLGATIHDVAQVVGAGFSVSEATGELATLVKLVRVTLLAPVVMIAALAVRRLGRAEPGAPRPPLVPGFVLAFLALAGLNSAGLVPPAAAEAASGASRWALIAAVAAVGMKTSIPKLLRVGGPAIAMLVCESLFLAAFVLIAALVLI